MTCVRLSQNPPPAQQRCPAGVRPPTGAHQRGVPAVAVASTLVSETPRSDPRPAKKQKQKPKLRSWKRPKLIFYIYISTTHPSSDPRSSPLFFFLFFFVSARVSVRPQQWSQRLINAGRLRQRHNWHHLTRAKLWTPRQSRGNKAARRGGLGTAHCPLVPTSPLQRGPTQARALEELWVGGLKVFLVADR